MICQELEKLVKTELRGGRNFSRNEIKALISLETDQSIIFKPSDKGGGVMGLVST